MSLEFRRKKSVEGTNDHDERINDANERAWSSIGSQIPYDKTSALEESRRRTMESLERITNTDIDVSDKQKTARQKVIDSYSSKSSEEPREQQFGYGKSGVGSFATLMIEKGRKNTEEHSEQQKLQSEKEEKWSILQEKEDDDTIVDEQVFIETKPTRIVSRGQLPNLNSLKAENEREWFRVANIPTAIFMSEHSGIIPAPEDPRKYLFSDQDGNNLFAHLANMGVGMSDNEKNHKAFAWQVAHFDFDKCIKDSNQGKTFDFDVNSFFQKNKHGISAVDILIQSGNLSGLKILCNMGVMMRSNQLLQPQQREVEYWDEATGQHRVREESLIINTSPDGDELLKNLRADIVASLDIVSSETAEKLKQLIQKQIPKVVER